MDGADPAAVTSSRLGFMLQRLTTEHQPPQDEARWSRPSDGNYASSSIHTTPALASKARRWNSQHGASIRTKPRHCVCGPLTQLPAGTKGKAGIKLKYKGHFPHSPSLFSIHQPYHNSFVVSYISVFISSFVSSEDSRYLLALPLVGVFTFFTNGQIDRPFTTFLQNLLLILNI